MLTSEHRQHSARTGEGSADSVTYLHIAHKKKNDRNCDQRK